MSLTQRLKTLQSLRTTLMQQAAPAAVQPLPPKFKSVASQMRDYYYPDIDVAKLSEQDSALKSLELKDQWTLARLTREEEFAKRGKIVRVGGRGKHICYYQKDHESH
ncbi:hypothetical protein HDU67_000706 [Dinochytrium kinnereticum]|nr:hypothetical protein HDU67_000706 [Dinochytrium kinnereticum]